MYSKLERDATVQRFRQTRAPAQRFSKEDVEKLTAWPQHLFVDGVKYTEAEHRDCKFTKRSLERILPQLCRDQRLSWPDGYFDQIFDFKGVNYIEFNQIVQENIRYLKEWNAKHIRRD